MQSKKVFKSFSATNGFKDFLFFSNIMSFSDETDDDDFDAIDALEARALKAVPRTPIVILITGPHIRWAVDTPYVRDLLERSEIVDVFDPVWTLVWNAATFDVPKHLDVVKVIVRPDDADFLAD
jgi:hypothetical protein